MNIFAQDEAQRELFDLFIPDVQKAVSETKTAAKTSEGITEGKASRDFGDYTENQYNNFGWVRANDVINEGYWNNFTRNYADALNNKNYRRITPNGEYMIEVYDENLPEAAQVIDHIVFAKGNIKSPNVTKIIQIYEFEENKLNKYRRNVYDFERRGIQQETGELLELHRKTDFGAYDNENYSGKVSGYSQQFGVGRSGSSKTTNRVKEYIFEQETEGKASRELDSLGNELTKGQTKYFRDSKVRNADGNLLVVYHGTKADFYTFEKGHKRTRGRLNFGDGFYFAAKKSYAENYIDKGDRLIEAYINLTNPYRVIGNQFTEWEMDDIRSKLSSNDAIKLNYDNVSEYLSKLGYDGVIGYDYSGTTKSINAVVAFESNQIKQVTNKEPTSNHDIRYSRELDLIDYINEKANVERAIMTKSQKLSQIRAELESMKVGKAELMSVQKIADALYGQYGGDASVTEFRYAMLEATKLALEKDGFDAAYEVISEMAKEVAYNPKNITGAAQVLKMKKQTQDKASCVCFLVLLEKCK